jgi:hypothetical protein
MGEREALPLKELEVDRQNLYREDVYTDLHIATIRVLRPVRADGSPDPGRATLFMGQTQILSNAGPLPVSCPLEAATLEEAIRVFPKAVNEAVERLVEEAREIQRREVSRIVVPDSPFLPGGPGGKIIPG